MNDRSTKVLIIEDSPGDIRLIQEMLGESGDFSFNLKSADRLSTGLGRLAEEEIDVVLLDLLLPDSEGLDTLVDAHSQAPGVPFIVMTSISDKTLAVKAVQAGAQDYLVKGQMTGELLARSMHYAIERHRLQTELEHAQHRQQREQEIRSLERLSSASRSAVTAQTFGLSPLREGIPEVFDKLVHRYGDLMDVALEERLYEVDHNVSEALFTLAERVGFLKAGPRDVVEIHTTALKTKIDGCAPAKAKAYTEESRLMVLELMGHLVSYYRPYSLGSRGVKASETHKGEKIRE